MQRQLSQFELDALSVTVPLKPPVFMTVTLSVVAPPGATDTCEGERVSIKPGVAAPPLHATPLTAKLVGTALVVPIQVP